jgi:DNA polymerase-3 subunit alpha
MASPRFVHLRIHSEFSITDGTVRIDDAVAAAVQDEMGALAITDLSNLFGLVRFYTAARSGALSRLLVPMCG